EVECIGKGKARQPYEFGVKVSLAITGKQGLIVGARAFAGNPYDSHTLAQTPPGHRADHRAREARSRHGPVLAAARNRTPGPEGPLFCAAVAVRHVAHPRCARARLPQRWPAMTNWYPGTRATRRPSRTN